MLIWVLTVSAFMSLTISVIVGWDANNSLERFRDILITIVSTVGIYLFLRLVRKFSAYFYDKFFMTNSKINLLIQSSISTGLLPKDYKNDPIHDLKLARMILHDRKIGLREKDIKHDLMLYLQQNS